MTQNNDQIKLTVDAVLFGYSREAGISVLLIKRKYEPFKGSWAIPGGFVLPSESLEEAVQRELEEETGVAVSYLEQLYTFGKPGRDPRGRVVSVAYFGLLKSSMFQKLQASTDAEQAQWFGIKKLPVLAFDHKAILQAAIERIRTKVRYEPIGFELLDKKFSFPDLEKMYAALLDKELDRRNFTKKILSSGLLEDTGDLAPASGAGRPGKVYQFNKKRYSELLKKGFHLQRKGNRDQKRGVWKRLTQRGLPHSYLHPHHLLVALHQLVPYFHHQGESHARLLHRDHRLVHIVRLAGQQLRLLRAGRLHLVLHLTHGLLQQVGAVSERLGDGVRKR